MKTVQNLTTTPEITCISEQSMRVPQNRGSIRRRGEPFVGMVLTPFGSVSATEAQPETAEVTRVREVESLRETNSET